jgi:hypothetical protein
LRQGRRVSRHQLSVDDWLFSRRLGAFGASSGVWLLSDQRSAGWRLGLDCRATLGPHRHGKTGSKLKSGKGERRHYQRGRRIAHQFSLAGRPGGLAAEVDRHGGRT